MAGVSFTPRPITHTVYDRQLFPRAIAGQPRIAQPANTGMLVSDVVQRGGANASLFGSLQTPSQGPQLGNEDLQATPSFDVVLGG